MAWNRKAARFIGSLNISGRQLPKHRKTSSAIKETDVIGYLVCIFVSIFFFMPFLIAASAIWNNIDPFYFVLEEYILPEAYNRTTMVTVTTIIIRLSLSTLCTLEFGRFAAIMICVLAVVVLCVLSVLNKIFLVSSRTAYRTYIEVQVAFAHGKFFKLGCRGFRICWTFYLCNPGMVSDCLFLKNSFRSVRWNNSSHHGCVSGFYNVFDLSR